MRAARAERGELPCQDPGSRVNDFTHVLRSSYLRGFLMLNTSIYFKHEVSVL